MQIADECTRSLSLHNNIKMTHCNFTGQIECSENTKCCLYVKKGETTPAFLGDNFHNGCERCSCRENEQGEVIHDCGDETEKKSCRNRCSYVNKDRVAGFAKREEHLTAFFDDEEGGCNKLCECKKEGKGVELVCGDHCILF